MATKDLEKATSSLRAPDLMELKSFKNPPVGVKDVLSATCILIGESKDWKAVCKTLGQKGENSIIQKMKNQDPKGISLEKASQAKALNVYSVAYIKKISSAATGFCSWNQAMIEIVEQNGGAQTTATTEAQT